MLNVRMISDLILSLGLKPQLLARLMKAIKADPDPSLAEDMEPEKGKEEPASKNAVDMIYEEYDDANSHDGIDIDMTDIIVLDEYDSTKKERRHKEPSKKRVHIISFYIRFLICYPDSFESNLNHDA